MGTNWLGDLGQMSNEKRAALGCLGYIGDEILPSIGIIS